LLAGDFSNTYKLHFRSNSRNYDNVCRALLPGQRSLLSLLCALALNSFLEEVERIA
jgi:hypothetical protein